MVGKLDHLQFRPTLLAKGCALKNIPETNQVFRSLIQTIEKHSHRQQILSGSGYPTQYHALTKYGKISRYSRYHLFHNSS